MGAGWRAGADAPGAVLVTAALMLGVYTIVDAHSVALGVLAAALLAAFVVRQATAALPLLPLRVLRSRNVVGANVAQMLMVGGMLGVFFLAVLYLQSVLGYDALATGTAFLPLSIVDRHALARVLGAPEHAVRRACGADRRARAGRGRPRVVRPRAGRRALRRRPAAGDDRDRRRRRAGVPGADDAGDVGRDAGGLRARVGAGEHDAAGRRRARRSVLATIAANAPAAGPEPRRWSTGTRSRSSWPRGCCWPRRSWRSPCCGRRGRRARALRRLPSPRDSGVRRGRCRAPANCAGEGGGRTRRAAAASRARSVASRVCQPGVD